MAEGVLDRLASFVGYGRLEASLWFLGMEESLGSRPERPGWSLAWELEVRAAWPPVVDVRVAHEALGDPYWERRSYSQVWKFMARLALGLLHGETGWVSGERVHRYVVERLGREAGETLLGELMPLPASGMGHWPYGALFPDRRAYEKAIWPRRQRLWQALLARHNPRFLIAYGKAYWPRYRALLGESGWRSLAGGRVLHKTFSGTEVFLTPFLGNGAFGRRDVAAILEAAG